MSPDTLQRKKTVMVVDDNEGILDIMRFMLEHDGYIVITANDGHYVRNLKAPLPDLLFLDIMLSGTDGTELCRELKDNKKTCDLPILILSANNQIQDISKACGADGYLSKPFDKKKMLELVELYTTRVTARIGPAPSM